MSLKTVLKAPGDNVVTFSAELIKTSFSKKINTRLRMKRKVIVNVLVKVYKGLFKKYAKGTG